MPLTTDFNVPPYFDDFDVDNNYYRILFKPATAVQARELTQIQSIIHNQIELFADSIYKPGTIIKGCEVNEELNQFFIRVSSTQSNGYTVDMVTLSNTIIESVNTGLQASILTYETGDESTYPNTNIFYVTFNNTGSAGEKYFTTSEQLNFYTKPRNLNLAIANVSIIANTSGSYATGFTRAVSVGSGVVYQKGFFTQLSHQTVIVATPTGNNTGFIINPNSQSIGFSTTESIVTSSSDSTLYDNAQGYSNFTAPGADRLKLVTTAISVEKADVAGKTDFLPIIQYSNDSITFINQDPQLSKLQDKFAQYSSDTNGNFIVKPFRITTYGDIAGNNQLMTVQINSGEGYVQGRRIKTIGPQYVTVRRGIDTQNTTSVTTSTNYGPYVLVKELSGNFSVNDYSTVRIYDTAQQNLTNLTFAGNFSPAGSQIGTAVITSIEYISGTAGTPDAIYAVYYTNVTMNSGYSFKKSAKSFVLSTGFGLADIILDTGSANNVSIFDNSIKTNIFNFGKRALKTLYPLGASDSSYVARISTATTLSVGGAATITLPQKGTTNNQPYSTTPSEYIVVLNGAAYLGANTASANGTLNIPTGGVSNAFLSTNVTVIGTGTKFQSYFNVGEYIITGNNEIRRIASIANDTFLTVSKGFSQAWSANVATTKFTKYYPNGYIVPMTSGLVATRSITANYGPSPSITLNIGSNTGLGLTFMANSLNTTVPITVHYNINRTKTLATPKNLYTNVYVNILLSNNAGGPVGPWFLGLPDVDQIKAVYANTTQFSNTGTNLYDLGIFALNKNDKFDFYNTSTLEVKGGRSVDLNKPYLTVLLDAFVPDMTSATGYYSVDSYRANTTSTDAVSYADIPVTVQDNKTYSLRDGVDFRTYKTTTASLATTIATATVNPTKSNTFNIDSTVGTVYAYKPRATGIFSSSIDYFLSRKDLVYFNSTGSPSVIEGAPNETPNASIFPEDSLPVAILNVQPFPSTTENEIQTLQTINTSNVKLIRDTSYYNNSTLIPLKRYTMRDIGVLDSRISRLEYYTSLTLLEQKASSLQIISADTGLNRFKNGFFVESFTSLDAADITNPSFKASIDLRTATCRPLISQLMIELEPDLSDKSETVIRNNSIVLSYEKVLFETINQLNASDIINIGNVNYNWRGRIRLLPSYSNSIDILAGGKASIKDKVEDKFINLSQPLSDLLFKNTSVSVDAINNTEQTDLGIIPKKDSSKILKNGNWEIDYFNLAYQKPKVIGFHATNLKPGSRVHVFFNGTNVDEFIAPGRANTYYTPFNGKESGDNVSDPIVKKPYQKIVKTGELGDQLIVSSGGRGAEFSTNVASNGFITSISINNGGRGYVNNGMLVISGYSTGGTTGDGIKVPGNNASAFIETTNANGTIISIGISNNGNDYSASNPPEIGAAGGVVAGLFYLPKKVFPTGQCEFFIADTASLAANTLDLTTTSARTTFSAEEYAVTLLDKTPAPISAPNNNGCCFDPDALITMSDGTVKKMCEIQIGDLVADGSDGINTVIGIEAPILGNRLMYSFNDNWAFISEEHPIMTSKGWGAFDPDSWAVEGEFIGKLIKINIGSEILKSDGTYETVEYIDHKIMPEDYVIYNLLLDGDHMYNVEGYVVHNKYGDNGGIPGYNGNPQPGGSLPNAPGGNGNGSGGGHLTSMGSWSGGSMTAGNPTPPALGYGVGPR